MNKFIQLSRIPASLLLVSTLASCGGSDKQTQTQTETPEVEAPVAEAQIQLNAASLRQVSLPAQSRSTSQTGVVREVASGQVLNASGEFKHPKPGAAFEGNISTAINVTDTDGIARVLLGFDQSEQYYVLCEENCANPFDAFVGGISPQLFGAESGEMALNVFIDDGVNPDLELATTVAINWQGKVISGVSVSHDSEAETLTVNWAADSDLLRYNVYIANDPNITVDNVGELEGGDARRSLETNTVTFDSKPADLDYYILVSGVDGTGESAYSGTIILIGGSETVPPTANNDTFAVNEDEVLTGNVLTNDSSNSTEAITVNLANAPAAENGLLQINQDGSFAYTPNTNFNGSDQFTYEIINEAGLTSQAIASITISAINDAPTSTEVTFIIDGDTLEQAAPGLLTNAVDIDGDSLSVSLNLITLPTFGSIQVFADGQFSYTAGETFVNYDNFQFQITDGIETVTVDASIVTADFNGSFPAIAVSDAYSTNEDTLLSVSAEQGLLANDFDEDGDISAATIAITQAPSNGNLTFAQDGSFTYTPAQDFFGQDVFQYALTDEDENTTSALVNLTIASQNDAPVANNDAYTLGNDMATTIFPGVGLLKNDSDVDGDDITVDVDSIVQPTSGAVEVQTSGRFVYTPSEGFVGTDSFTYQVTDGQANSNTATVSLSVFDVYADANDNEDLVINVEDISNLFSDNAVLVGVTAEKGTATFNQDSVTFTPTYNESGFADLVLEFESQGETFNYTLTVRIIQTNQAPEFDAISNVSVDENANEDLVIATLSATDSEMQGLTFALSDNANTFEIDAETGELSVLADATIDFESETNFNVTATVTDTFGLTDSLTFSIAVNDTNENPTFTSANSSAIDENPEIGTVVYTATATDPDNGDTFSFSFANSISGLDLNTTTGAITVSDPSIFDHETTESLELNLLATDTGGLSDALTVTLTVNDSNEAPSISSSTQLLDDVAENFSSNSSTQLYQFSVTDTDDGDSLNWTLTADANFNIDSQTGVIEIIANPTFDYETTSSYTLTAVVTDNGGLSDSIELTLPISNVNEAPTANVDYVSVTNYSNVNIDVLVNDTDPENDVLLVTSASATNGAVSIESDYSLTYTPDNDITNDTITYTVEDTGGLTHTATVEVTIDPLALAGSHDVNLDGSSDLSASYDSNNNLWTIDITSGVSNAFVVSNNRYYPLEKQTDNSFTTSLDGSVNDHEIRLIISGKVHVFKAVDLTTTAAATIDFSGTTLTTNVSDMTLPASFVDATATYNGTSTNEAIAVYPQIRRGATIELNEDGTGSYINVRGQENFSWTSTSNQLIVIQDNPETDTDLITVQDLLDMALISQSQYDDYVNNTGTAYDQLSVTSVQNSITLTFTSNQVYYYDVTESQNVTYTLPVEFSSSEVTLDEQADEYRLYSLSNLGTYSNSDVGAGNYVLGYFEYTDGEPDIGVAENATLNADNTGMFDDLGVTFTWSINSSGNLEIAADNNISYEYTVVQGQDNQSVKEVYMVATDNNLSERVSMLYFMVQDSSPTNADVLAKLENQHWNSAFGQRDPAAYTNGVYNGSNVFGFVFDTTAATNAPAGENAANRVWSGESFLQVSDWTWTLTGNSVELIRYLDFAAGFGNCDPDSNSTCFPYQKRTWTINHIDSATGRMFVSEYQETLDLDPYYEDGSVVYTTNIVNRINYYTIAEQLTTASDTASVDEDNSVANINVVANDLDSDGGSDVVLLNTVSSQGGTTTNDSSTFDYTPRSDFSGTDDVYYLATDANNALGFEIATVTVNPINDAPVAIDDSFTVNEGETYYSLSLVSLGTDIEGDPISLISTSGATNGSITDNGDGSIDYIHDGGETTSDTFTYTISDGELTDTATVTVTISPVNDAPQFTTSILSHSVNEGESLVIDYDATDAEGDNISFSYSTSTGGAFSFNNATGELTFNAPSFEAPYDDGNDNSYDVAVIATDDSSAADSTSLSLVFNVLDINDAPVISSGGTSFTIQENDTSVVTVFGSDEDTSDTLTFSLSGDDASAFSINSSTGVIEFSPAPDYDSPSDANSDNVYLFNAIVTDSGGLSDSSAFTITVSDINEAPTLTNGSTSFNVDENQTAAFTATATDEDAGTTLTYSLSGTDAALFNIGSTTGVVTFVSAPNHESPSDYDVDGKYDFDVWVTDGNSNDTLSVSVTVDNVNEAPTLSSGSSPLNVNENQTTVTSYSATDEDTSETLTFSLTGTDAALFAIGSSTGVITFNSAPDFESHGDNDADGNYDFDVVVTDAGGLTDTTSLTVTVDNVNEAPVFTSLTTASVNENETNVMTLTATDPEGDSITFSKSSPNTGSDPEFFSVASGGALTFSALPNFEGPDDANSDNDFGVEVEVTDGSLTTTEVITVTLVDVVENTELTLVSSFANNGVLNFNTYASTQATSSTNADFIVDVQRDDSGNHFVLVQSGSVYTVSKIKSDGTLDTDFGFNGRKPLQFNSLQDVNVEQFDDNGTLTQFVPQRLRVDTNSSSSHYQKVYVLGYQVTSTSSWEHPFILRLNTDGKIDSSFSSDGKFENSITLNDASDAQDLLMHSDGSLYLAVRNLTSSGNVRKFKVINVDTDGNQIGNIGQYDFTGSTNNEVIFGMVENSASNIVVFGGADDSGDDQIAVAVIDKDDLDNSTLLAAAQTFGLGVSLDQGSVTKEYISAYVQASSDTLYLGGYVDKTNTGKFESLIVKLDLASSPISLDTSYNGTGYYYDYINPVDDGTDASEDEQVISMAINNNGDVAYTRIISSTPTSGNFLYLSQTNSSGAITSLGTTFQMTSNELTDTEGAGITGETSIRAFVTQDAADSSNAFKVMSAMSLIHNASNDVEVESYLSEFDSSGSQQNNWVYDFEPVTSLQTPDTLLHSSGDLLTFVHRDNTASETTGLSIFNHNSTTGVWDQTFGSQGTINFDANDYDGTNQLSDGAVELSDGTFIAAVSSDDFSNLAITLTHYKADGTEVQSGDSEYANFPVTVNFAENTHFYGADYNATAGKIMFVGESTASDISRIVVVDATNGSVLTNTLIDMVPGGAYNGLFAVDLQDDGSAFVAGQAKYPSRTNIDGFMAKLTSAVILDTNFDGDSGDSDDVILLEFDATDTTNHYTQLMETLSDGSFVIISTTFGSNYNKIKRVEENSGSPGTYQIDTDFDSAEGDDNYEINLDAFLMFSGTASIDVRDSALDNNDNLYLVGEGDFNGTTTGWVLKFNALTGTVDPLFGSVSSPGYSVPHGYLGCGATNSVEIDICDVFLFEKVVIDEDGNLILQGIGQGPEGYENTFMFKFTESQDDTASSYNVYAFGGA